MSAVRALVVLALLLTGCSSVGPLVRADVQRGLEIATAAQDAAGVACATAILQSLPEPTQAPQPIGVFSLFMATRELRRAKAGGVSEAVHNACSPLIMDAQTTLSKLGLSVVPGGGALGGLIR